MKAVLLDNIRSAWNVGSILRCADGFGFSHAYLCGITPTPEVDAVRKTALGAEEYVTWSSSQRCCQAGKRFENKKAGKLAHLKKINGQFPFPNLPSSKAANPFVLILGSEVTGVDPELLDLADHIFYIPMRGQKRSFNVANAFSIAAYALRKLKALTVDFNKSTTDRNTFSRIFIKGVKNGT